VLDEDTMSVEASVEVPVVTAQLLDVLVTIDQLQARVGAAERRAANMEQALATNRRIGIAIGILMCQHQMTDDRAFAMLTTHSQHHIVTVRELAETVIYTGTL
jgi:AmiR/NasT family two-component response regulator